MKFPYALVLSSVFAYSVHGAIVIDVTTVDDRVFGFPPPHLEILDNEGDPVEEGNRVLIGSFDIDEADSPTEFFGANQGDLFSLFSSFTPISSEFRLSEVGDRETTFNSGPGRIITTDLNALAPLNLPKEDFGFTALTPIYLFVLKTDDNGSDIATDFSNVTQLGVFSSTNPEWNFGDAPLRSVILRTQDIDQFFISGGVSGVPDLSLALIPEPSAFALVGGFLALAGFAVRRRR